MVVYSDDGNALSEGVLFKLLKMIVEENSASTQHPPVGVLTAEDRTFWAKHRKAILKGKCNKMKIEDSCVVQK